MRIIVAETAGFCFGVKRAMEMVREALDTDRTPITSLGPLIHNPQVVKNLEAAGLSVAGEIEAIPEGRVVIRSHGVGPSIYQKAAEKGLSVIDATCPFVKNVQQLAVMLRQEQYQVVIFGEQDHAEVRGVMDSVSGEALILDDPASLRPESLTAKVGVISQTTQDVNSFQEIVAAILTHVKELRVFNTICLATSQRQSEAASLSRQVDLMIVVGGKNSANTTRLAEICRNNGTQTYQVEGPDELDTGWFAQVKTVGVTAGASTPETIITAVIEKINSIGGNQP